MTQDVTTPVQIEAGRAERDGCDCYAMGEDTSQRCAHWDGQVVYLAMHEDRPGEWRVSQGDEEAPLDWTGTGHLVHTVFVNHTLDYEAALEAFHAAEERLLRGEPS